MGDGGYAPDGLGYPICTDGTHSCLWYQAYAKSLSLHEFRYNQLETIFHNLPRRADLGFMFRNVVEFIVGENQRSEPDAEPDAEHGVQPDR